MSPAEGLPQLACDSATVPLWLNSLAVALGLSDRSADVAVSMPRSAVNTLEASASFTHRNSNSTSVPTVPSKAYV